MQDNQANSLAVWLWDHVSAKNLKHCRLEFIFFWFLPPNPQYFFSPMENWQECWRGEKEREKVT
jgi:hypothetical protein